MSSGYITSNSPTSDSSNSRTMTSNHVAATSPTVGSTSEAVANSNPTTSPDLNSQLALITLNTPEASRRGQDSDVASRGSSPGTTSGARVGMAVASTVGVASAGGGTGEGRGSGTSSPAPFPASQSQQSIQSRTSSNQRPAVSASSSQPRPPQQTPTGSIIVHPPQQASGMHVVQ